MNGPLFRAHRFAPFAQRISPWPRGERWGRRVREGHGQVSALAAVADELERVLAERAAAAPR